MLLSCKVIEEINNNDLWLLDSGYNNHMIGNKDLFSTLDYSFKSKIKLGVDH